MCMFRCLKTSDIILSLVSSKKLDWTHTFGTCCILDKIIFFEHELKWSKLVKHRQHSTEPPSLIAQTIESLIGSTQTCCKLPTLSVGANGRQVATNLSILSICNKSVKVRHFATCHLKTCSNLLKQLAESL